MHDMNDTPWTAEFDGHGGISLETQDGTQIACLKSSRKAYADRIVQCVNCHEELVEALEDALKTAEFQRDLYRPWHENARLVIAKAKTT